MTQPNENPHDQPSDLLQQPSRSPSDDISDDDLDAMAGGAGQLNDGCIKRPPILPPFKPGPKLPPTPF